MDDEHKFHIFYEKCVVTEAAADALGEVWKGCVVQISGGDEKQYFLTKCLGAWQTVPAVE